MNHSRSCDTEPNAFLRSSQRMRTSFLLRLASHISDSMRKECSKQPSTGRKPFCDGEIFFSNTAHAANRFAMTAAKILYTVGCSEMGLQLPGREASPLLGMRMVFDRFQESGKREFSRQVLKRLVSRGTLAGVDFHSLYSTRSGPGADCQGSLLSWASTSASHTRWVSSSLVLGVGGGEEESSQDGRDSPRLTAGLVKWSWSVAAGISQEAGFSPRIVLMQRFLLALYQRWNFLASLAHLLRWLDRELEEEVSWVLLVLA